jgi:hypothetical protein
MQPTLDFAFKFWNSITSIIHSIWSVLPSGSNFWSGIIGAIVGAAVGGIISYLIQMSALREKRKHRREDRLSNEKALANALLFKVIRIYSNLHSMHRHIEDCFETAEKDGFKGEPWQFVLPLANFPELVHLSSDEMGMLLGLKDNDVFNSIIDVDVVHNGLVEAMKIMSSARRALAEGLKADEARGNVLSGNLDKTSYFALKPQMIEVDSMINAIKVDAKRNVGEAHSSMKNLHKLLKDRLGITYKIESKFLSDLNAE